MLSREEYQRINLPCFFAIWGLLRQCQEYAWAVFATWTASMHASLFKEHYWSLALQLACFLLQGRITTSWRTPWCLDFAMVALAAALTFRSLAAFGVISLQRRSASGWEWRHPVLLQDHPLLVRVSSWTGWVISLIDINGDEFLPFVYRRQNSLGIAWERTWIQALIL